MYPVGFLIFIHQDMVDSCIGFLKPSSSDSSYARIKEGHQSQWPGISLFFHHKVWMEPISSAWYRKKGNLSINADSYLTWYCCIAETLSTPCPLESLFTLYTFVSLRTRSIRAFASSLSNMVKSN